MMNNEFITALNQQKSETCAIFCARLNKLATHIRTTSLSPSEAAELLDLEAEKMASQQRGDNQ